MTNRFACVGAVLAMLSAICATASKADPAAPEPGFYSFNVTNGQIEGAKPCRNYGFFLFADGGSSLYWPGLGAKGAVLRKIDAGPNSVSAVRVINLPKTPATADGKWFGKVTSTVVPDIDASTFLIWNATITLVDASSFRLTYALRVSTPDGICRVRNDVNLLRTG